VVGAGSVGTFFAAQLEAAGVPVIACVRRPFDRYLVESDVAPVDVPATALTDPADAPGPVRWVLLAVKAHQTEGARPWLNRLCGPETTVVVVQNGVEQEARGRAVAGPARVLPAVVYCGTELLAPGRVRHHARSTLLVPVGDDADELAAVFGGTPCTIRPTDAWRTEAWRKLGANVALNGITALTMRRTEVVHEPAVQELAVRVVAECWAVGRAEGAEVSEGDAEAMVRAMATGPGGGGTSMYYDRMAGRVTEHDAIYGAVVRAGARHGIPVPLHQAMLVLLGACSTGSAG